MEAVFHIEADEFDENFFKQVNSILQSKKNLQVTIAISEKESTGFLREETSDQYFTRLDQAIENLIHGHTVSYTMDEFEAYTKQLVNEP